MSDIFSRFVFVRNGIFPDDAMLLDVLAPLFACRNVDAIASTVDDLGLILFCVDLQFKVVRWLAYGYFADDLYRLAARRMPFIPAALIPIPCWPRLIRSL